MGAGLNAMQAPRFFSCSEVMLSQASQLPHFRPAAYARSGFFQVSQDVPMHAHAHAQISFIHSHEQLMP
ncbi:hypothetical protein EJ576_14945 [Pseudomonas sp. C 49-2]|nr:hypothetical protein EJ576_14945 [Pseudomonas sp. C 49-2]